MSPEELFTGSVVGCKILQKLRVFGCPAYVLDPRLQDGKKIPKWQPRAREGQFLGFSNEHSSTVGLIRNLRTNHISPQFHVVYDEKFETVTSDMKVDLEEVWFDLFHNSRETYLEWYDPSFDQLPPMDPEYLPQGELPQPYPSVDAIDNVPNPNPGQPSVPQQPSASEQPSIQGRGDKEQRSEATQPQDPPIEIDSDDESDDSHHISYRRRSRRLRRLDPSLAETELGEDSVSEPVPLLDQTVIPGSPGKTRRGTRYRRATSASHHYRPIKNRVFAGISHIQDPENTIYATLDWDHVDSDPLYKHFHDMFTRFLDPESYELLDAAGLHPFLLVSKLNSDDFPSFKEVMRMPKEEQDKWFDSMDEELQALFDQGTLEFVPRSEPESKEAEIVKTTWALRKKRHPSGEVYRYKSRLCVRGDLQRLSSSMTLNETFAPVVDWGTLRMLFSLSIAEQWKSASIDFKNAFAQADLPEPIYLELPPGYAQANPESRDFVLKVKKSLYGDRRAANLWYLKLRSTLENDLHFKVSELDPCLFIRSDCVIVLYVDDAIIFGKDDDSIDKLLSELKDKAYDFSRDGSFSSYLGIKLDHRDDGTIKMSQPGLKQATVDVMGLSNANSAKTPITGPLFRHDDSPPFDGRFNYRSALGMLQYIGNNTHPECAYAINACARFCVTPRQVHGSALERIGRYLLGCMEDGLIIDPSGPLALDCYVDADFAGNYNKQDSDDPRSVYSRTGFVITLGNVPVLWRSKLQTEIALSTMESEYIALSTAMRTLIHLRGVLFELAEIFNLSSTSRLSTISTVFEDNQACRILATTNPPRLTPRSKSLAVKYHWFRSHLSEDTIVIKDIPSDEQLGDGFTKALVYAKFLHFRRALCGW